MLPSNQQGLFGSLAQLVQSVCLTSRGSGVRLPQLPQIENQALTGFRECLFRMFSATLSVCGILRHPATAKTLQKLYNYWYNCRNGLTQAMRPSGNVPEDYERLSSKTSATPACLPGTCEPHRQGGCPKFDHTGTGHLPCMQTQAVSLWPMFCRKAKPERVPP